MAAREDLRVALPTATHRETTGRDAWVWGVGAWMLLRVVTTGAALASSLWIRGGSTVPVPGYATPELSGLADRLAGVWLRADALWYLRVATGGYTDTGTFAFLPAFPMAVRVLRPLFGGNELLAGLVVANAACVLGFVFLYRFVETLLGADGARVTVAGLAVFPTAFFLVSPYGEPVFLAAGAGALLAAQRGRFGLAGVAGALAALSRPFGSLLALPLAGLVWKKGGRAWPAPAGPLAGGAVWAAFAAVRLGDPLGALSVQSTWQRAAGAPWSTVADAVRTWWSYRGTALGPYFLLDLAMVAFAVALTIAAVVALRRRNIAAPVVAALASYAALVVLLPLCNPFPGRPLLSFPRFALALFPVFPGYALIPPRFRLPLGVLSAVGLGLATAMYVAARPIF
jgi:hypothetical protein